MAERNTGGPAFPVRHQNQGDRNWITPTGDVIPPRGWAVGFGMTLRDYLAARAMQAALTNWPADAGDWMRERAELAQRAYAMADAMLEARNA